MTKKARYKQLEYFGFGPNVMKKIRICPHCGSVSSDNSVFCLECGEKLPHRTLFDRYKQNHRNCSNCGTVLTSDSLYCPHCGRRVIPKAVLPHFII